MCEVPSWRRGPESAGRDQCLEGSREKCARGHEASSPIEDIGRRRAIYVQVVLGIVRKVAGLRLHTCEARAIHEEDLPAKMRQPLCGECLFVSDDKQPRRWTVH